MNVLRCFLALVAIYLIHPFEGKSQEINEGEYLLINHYDGSIFLGDYLGRDSKGLWRIKIVTGDTIHVNPLLISEYLSSESSLIFDRRKYHLLRGLSLTGNVSFSEDSGLADVLASISVTDRITAGLGIGISSHFAFFGGVGVINDFTNVFGYGRYYLNQGKWRYYADTKLGYAFSINQDPPNNQSSGGLLFNPGLGVTFSSRNELKWHIGISQYIQNYKGEDRSVDRFGNLVDQEYNIWYNRTIFSVGISYVITNAELRQLNPFK